VWTVQAGECGENSEYISSYNDWIVINSSKQNFVAKPFHVNEVSSPSNPDVYDHAKVC